jgi:hypothetical protein
MLVPMQRLQRKVGFFLDRRPLIRKALFAVVVIALVWMGTDLLLWLNQY